MTCKDCNILKKAELSEEPAACVWYIDNVICGNKTVEDCPYRKVE